MGHQGRRGGMSTRGVHPPWQGPHSLAHEDRPLRSVLLPADSYTSHKTQSNCFSEARPLFALRPDAPHLKHPKLLLPFGQWTELGRGLGSGLHFCKAEAVGGETGTQLTASTDSQSCSQGSP